MKLVLDPTRFERHRRLSALLSFALGTSVSGGSLAENTKPPRCHAPLQAAGYEGATGLQSRKSKNPYKLYLQLAVPLNDVRVVDQGLREAELAPSLHLYQEALLSSPSTPLSMRFDISFPAALRPLFPKPTGCTLVLDGETLSSPQQMRGVEETSHTKLRCEYRLAADQIERLLMGRQLDFIVHDAFDRTLLVAQAKATLPKAVRDRLLALTSQLREQAAANQCVPSDNSHLSGCFVTTAVCDVIGLPDDCFELTQLRRFRDRWLFEQPGGSADIAHYYASAPAICEQLAGSASGQRSLLRLYWHYILPCAIAARLGTYRLARSRYTQMMRSLGVEAAT